MKTLRILTLKEKLGLKGELISIAKEAE